MLTSLWFPAPGVKTSHNLGWFRSVWLSRHSHPFVFDQETEGENPSNDLLEARKEQKRVAFSIPQDPARDWGLARLVGGEGYPGTSPSLCSGPKKGGGNQPGLLFSYVIS